MATEIQIQWTNAESVLKIGTILESPPNRPIGKEKGVYIWTYGTGSLERIYYIGSTRRSFRQRITEEIRQVLSGHWSTYSLPEETDFYEVLFKYLLKGSEKQLPDWINVYRPPSADVNTMVEYDFSGGSSRFHNNFIKRCGFYFGTIEAGGPVNVKWVEYDLIRTLRNGFKQRYGLEPVVPGGRADDFFFGRSPGNPPTNDRIYKHSNEKLANLLHCTW